MKVTVVIPNYNGMKFMKTCLDSLRLQNYKEFKTLVIDNASEDGSYEYVNENYPEVEVVRLKKNYGFSGAVNKGIDLSDTPYVLLLNNDTESDKDFVGEMVKAIEKEDEIFACSSKMINFNDRELMDDAGDLYALPGWAFQRGVGRSVDDYCEDAEVFSACAGAAIYRKEVFDKIGKFDLKHFAYLEDIDVCYRAKIYGYKNVYCSSAIVYHVGSGTSGSKYNSFKVKLAARNNIYVIYKNMPFLQQVVNMPFIIAGFLVKYMFFNKIGFSKDYRDGMIEGIKTMHKLKKVEYDENNLYNYLVIQKEMIFNSFIYVKEYFERHI